MTSINSDEFTYNKETKTFIAERSDLKKYSVGPDGFEIISAKTGAKRQFVYMGKILNGEMEDEEVVGWKFEMVPQRGAGVNEIGIKAIVYND